MTKLLLKKEIHLVKIHTFPTVSFLQCG